MNEKHYREQLSSFVNHELPNDERQTIGAHLLLCANCRAEHDRIKLGAVLAQELKSADAPENLWNKIENALPEKEKKAFSMDAFFNSRGFAAMAGLLLVCGSAAAIYFGLLQNRGRATLENETSANRASIQPREMTGAQDNQSAWNVETLTGTPKIGDSSAGEKLSVGQFLETDADSRARVRVANIGQVEVAPNSRVQLVKTDSAEHRLSLERGVLRARILAPPRLFIVDTPSAVAVDLGCEYTLEVNANGDSTLRVTSGFVALERGGRESIVPAGAMALTKKGAGLGTPFAEDAAPEFRDALYKFDFENGGNDSLKTLLQSSDAKTSLTLWHLLARAPESARERVFTKLNSFVALPEGITKAGVLKLDEKMLAAWRAAVEDKWFEIIYR